VEDEATMKKDDREKIVRAAVMSESEISERVFHGARSYELRSLRGAFTLDEIAAIANNQNAGRWRWQAIGIVQWGTVQTQTKQMDV